MTDWVRLKQSSGSYLGQRACSNRATYSKLPRTMSRSLLNISNKGHPTKDIPGQLVLILSHPHWKHVSWCSDGMSCVPVCSHCLLSCFWTESLFIFCSDIFILWWVTPLSLLFSRLNVLSLFFYDGYPKLFIIFVSLCGPSWLHSFQFVLICCVLRSLELSMVLQISPMLNEGKGSPLILQTTLLLVHPGVVLVFFATRTNCSQLTANLVSNRTSGHFLKNCLPWYTPGMNGVNGDVLAQEHDFTLPLG